LNSRIWKIFICVAALGLAAQCTTTDRTRRGYLRDLAGAYVGAPARPVIVVAGFGVTRLVDPVTGRHVWGTAHAMWQTEYADDLDLPESGGDRLIPRGWVGSRGPVNIGWQLSIALRKYGGYTWERDVLPFYYDWRLSARHNAQLLARLVEQTRAQHGGRKVDLVTHSAGSIVALTYVKLAGGGDDVERLILIAPTRHGVVDAFRVFVRPEKFIRRSFEPNVVATWPFISELLPEEGRFLIDEEGKTVDLDLWQAASWSRFGTNVPRGLSDARRLRDELRDTPLPPGVQLTVIAGDCVPTARRVLMRKDGTFAFYARDLRDHERPLAPLLFAPGDGTVPADPDALRFCDGHQGIASDPSVHRAVIRTLRE
jgi:pimeloyl-ACP methyl ester carboxylesterase